MELENAGHMLRGLYGTDSLPLMGKQILASPSSDYPQMRSNTVGMRVDVYGEVLTFTREYEQGWRVFDAYACMYKEDGAGRDAMHHLIGDYPNDQSPRPPSCYQWVHPNHLQIGSLFPLLEPGRSRLVGGRSYLNRMGFVVVLETNIETTAMLRDTHGNLYYTTGRRYGDGMSMTDLVYEISDWDHFSSSDWSEPDVIKNQKKSAFSAAHYDPAAESREELLRRFYDTLAEAHGLAKKIDAVFSFTMDTNKR